MIVLVKGIGTNIASLQYALDRLGFESILSAEPDVIKRADMVILPGVGHATCAMQNLRTAGLAELIPQLTQPVLGICLGMQLFYEYLTEGEIAGLGIIPGAVTGFNPSSALRIPHMGWNALNFLAEDGWLQKADTGNSYVYFVHSYKAPINQYTLAQTDYGEAFSSIVKRKNFIGMQFHPERSGEVGEQLLKSVIENQYLIV